MACFWAAKQSPEKSLSIDFEWKAGLAAKDWSKVAKKGQVEVSFPLTLLQAVNESNRTKHCSCLFRIQLGHELFMNNN